MTPTIRSVLLSIATFAASTVVTAAVHERDASAETRVRVAGKGHGHKHARRDGYRRVRDRRPVTIHVGGYVHVGAVVRARWAAPPPPPPSDCGCEGTGYHPVVADAATSPSPAPHARLPRWGFGVGAGGVAVQGVSAGDDLALLGRYRLTPRWFAEGELGKTSLGEGARVDRRLGGSLVYEVHPRRRWSPYAVGGVGVTQVEVGDGAYANAQSFGEVGLGLRLALSPSLHLGLDLRAGSRTTLQDEAQPLDAAARMVTPTEDEPEAYTRARLSAVVYF